MRWLLLHQVAGVLVGSTGKAFEPGLQGEGKGPLPGAGPLPQAGPMGLGGLQWTDEGGVGQG